ncbi:MAG: DNA-processing protein DprA [Salaquimonas sp.]|jgi:DNA processing protein|nr:DNA-processing protein DprA [Salaquimonas sp.]
MNPATDKGRLTLSDEQRLAWLRLIRSDNVGPATFRDLINHFGTAAAALEALPELARRGGVAARIRVASEDQAEREMDAAERIGARFVATGEPDYPPLLRGLDHPPPLICVRGDIALALDPCVAVVGARNASITGAKLATRFAAGLGEAGYPIVSGLARGIDAAAHKATLATGTIAVFAGGLDMPFPDENAALAGEIVERGGAIVSEMPIGWQPRSKDFPRRNRLIAGIALGVLVVEAAKRSGSLITARLANETGRQVFAVPGSPLDPRAEGTNHLIKQGATLVTDVSDIVESLQPVGGGETQLPYLAGESDDEPWREREPGPAGETDQATREAIIAALGPSPVEIDDIVRFSGAGIAQVQLVLIELDLAGRLERHPGNRVSIQP